MGHTEDPKDGGAVSATVFGAVAVYAVCGYPGHPSNTEMRTYTVLLGYCF